MGEKEVRIIDRTESVLESIFKDVVTFSFLIFCIWLSQGSTWWTFLTGTLFLIGLFTRVGSLIQKRCRVFKSKKELIEWVNSFEWPERGKE